MIPHEAVHAAKQETKSAQAHRLVDYLLVNDVGLTGEICQACALVNISAAANIIRPALQRHGMTIIATLPKPLIQNRFGEKSQSHEWRLVRLR